MLNDVTAKTTKAAKVTAPAPEAAADVALAQQASNNSDTNSTAKVDVPAPETKVSGLAKGVPLPPVSGGGGKAKYPWETMEVGDAFFVENAKVETFYTLTNSAAKKYGRKYVSRKLADGAAFGPEFAGKPGVGVWRTA